MNRRMDSWQNGCYKKMNDHLVYTTPNHLALPNWMFLQIFFPFTSSMLLNGKSGIQVRPSNSSDDLCLLFCLFLLLYWLVKQSEGWKILWLVLFKSSGPRMQGGERGTCTLHSSLIFQRAQSPPPMLSPPSDRLTVAWAAEELFFSQCWTLLTTKCN